MQKHYTCPPHNQVTSVLWSHGDLDTMAVVRIMEHTATSALARDEAISSCDLSASHLLTSTPSSHQSPLPQTSIGFSDATDAVVWHKPITQSDDISPSYISGSAASQVTTKDESILTVDPDYENNMLSIPSATALALLLPRSSRKFIHRQRQIDAQLLRLQNPTKSVSACMKKMISSGDQCHVAPPPALSTGPLQRPRAMSMEPDDSPPPNLEIDEGFFEGVDDDEAEIDRVRNGFIRACDLARHRKNVLGANVIFQRPRMRKNITRRKRVAA